MEKKAPTKKQLAARKKFTAMVKKKPANKKTSINDTIIRVPSKTRKVKKVTLKRSNKGTFQTIKGDCLIELNLIGWELWRLDIEISTLTNDKKIVKLKADKMAISETINTMKKQHKALKMYLNTRAKFF